MTTEPQYAIHSLRRVEARVGIANAGVVMLYFLVVALVGAFSGGFGSIWLGPEISIRLTALGPFAVLLNVCCMDAMTYALARECGLVAANGNDSARLSRLPVYAVSAIGAFLIALLVVVYVSPMTFILFVILLLAAWWFVPGRKARRVLRNLRTQLDDLFYALAPPWPAGAPGVEDPFERRSGFARRVLVLRTVDHVGVLRLIQEHGPVTSIRFLPRLTVRQLLVEAFPRLVSLLPHALQISEKAPEEVDLREVVADWGQRSHLEWHGVLDDGTHVIRNEGEVRIVPRDGAVFEDYRRQIVVHAPAMGIRTYYVQEGGALRVENCAFQGVPADYSVETGMENRR